MTRRRVYSHRAIVLEIINTATLGRLGRETRSLGSG